MINPTMRCSTNRGIIPIATFYSSLRVPGVSASSRANLPLKTLFNVKADVTKLDDCRDNNTPAVIAGVFGCIIKVWNCAQSDAIAHIPKP